MNEEISSSFAKIARSPVFIKDASEVARISNDEFKRLASALVDSSQCFSRLPEYLEDKIESTAGLQSLINFLLNLTRLRIAYKLSSDIAEDLLKPVIKEALDSNGSSETDTQVFLERLPALLADYDLVKREIRLSELGDKAAATLEELIILCDLRPLFSEDGSEIEYISPHATLHIQFDVAGQSQSHDIQVSEKQIDEIMEKAIRAKKKLSTLASFAGKASLTMADV
jgi:hypothetical protein